MLFKHIISCLWLLFHEHPKENVSRASLISDDPLIEDGLVEILASDHAMFVHNLWPGTRCHPKNTS